MGICKQKKDGIFVFALSHIKLIVVVSKQSIIKEKEEKKSNKQSKPYIEMPSTPTHLTC